MRTSLFRRCDLCDHAIQRIRWIRETWDSEGRPAGGRAIEAGLRCAVSRELVGWDDCCPHFRWRRGSSQAVEAF
jgi:hypothetical protein